MSVDANAGLISGTLPVSAASSTPYSVTVTVSDGTLTAQQTFTWSVTKGVVTLTNPGDQTNTEGDSVSLQLSASDSNDSPLSYQANGLPDGLSVNSSGLISGTIASGAADNGPYVVTVTATDADGYGSSQQFFWTVNAPANALTLTNPGDQSNAEGDDVSLQLSASDPDGDFLTYTAGGLPIGLIIDPISGLISGTVDYSAAEIAGGQYNVTITVNDGNGETVSKSLVWTITDTDQGPWLAYPEMQSNNVGDSVSLRLNAGSPDGKVLSYTATNLPPDLSINPETGLISGTISGSMQNYSVTATVSDGIKTAQQTFTWQVGGPRVLLSFDGQPVGEDYLAEVDPATPISVKVTLQGATLGMRAIQISIPSGKSQVDQPTFQLPNGGSKTIELTPEEESQEFDDVLVVAYVDGKEAGDAEGTNPKVTIAGETKGGDIKNSDTPKGMADRIPPRVPTYVQVTITPTLKDAKVVDFKILGNSADNGNGNAAFVNSDKEQVDGVWMQASGVLPLTAPGTGQTNQGHAGNLVIVAYPATKTGNSVPQNQIDTKTVLAKSAGFSVAAIPIRIQSTLVPQQLRGDDVSKKGSTEYSIAWGVQYNIDIKSDSGNPQDLDQILISERIKPDKNNPSSDKLITSAFLPANKLQVDTNAKSYFVPKQIVFKGKNRAITPAFARKNALEILQETINKAKPKNITDLFYQQFEFKDNRTGSVNADGEPIIYTVANSGFKIERTLTKKGAKYLEPIRITWWRVQCL